MPDQIAAPLDQPAYDLRERCWFDAVLPPFARDWARLGRWDRMAGVWLLYWPCAWGLMLAPHFWLLSFAEKFYWLGLFLIGAFVMRGAGCTINDLWDRKLDAQVARTASRPLAAGRTRVFSALIFLLLQLIAGAWIWGQLPFNAQLVSLFYLPLIVVYPLMKRVTMWPQAFLSIVFSAGAIVGWVTMDMPNLATAVLVITAMLWVLAYDTVYAHMDKADDAMVGIKSTVIGLGERAVDLVVVCLWATSLGWALLAAMYDFPPLACSVLIFSYVLQFFRCVLWNPDNDRKTLDYFRSQCWFGGAWAFACWFNVLQHVPVHG